MGLDITFYKTKVDIPTKTDLEESEFDKMCECVYYSRNAYTLLHLLQDYGAKNNQITYINDEIIEKITSYMFPHYFPSEDINEIILKLKRALINNNLFAYIDY